MVYPENFELKIEFDKIRQLVKDKCICELARQKVDSMKFSKNFEFIRLKLIETDEFKTVCLLEDGFPTTHYPDDTQFLYKARIEGAFLESDELFNLRRSLETVRLIIHFFKTKSEEKYTHLLSLCTCVNYHKFIAENLEEILDKNGIIKDSASSELAIIRRALHEKQHTISRRLNILLKQAQNEGWATTDLSLTLVNGRTVLPIDSTHKRKIKGLVHAESATGKTSYIEPSEIVELNNEIKELEYNERKEIVKILILFTDKIRPYLEDIFYAYDFLAEFDFIRAKALYAININAILPAIVNEQIMLLAGGKHPLLYTALKKEGRGVVPLTIDINSSQRVIVISGPNAGGKSVCLKTVGILQYMFQCGLLVPVSGSSEFGVFDNIFIDIGDEQSIENDLSTYSSHLKNMKYFIKNSNDKTMLLIDEFGAGTEPIMGGAIAEAVLEKINSNKSKAVITTHYSNLKHFASSAEGVANAAMLYDSVNMEPLFMLETGKPGSSFAFEIARKIGLPEDVINSATEKAGKDHIYFDKHLREVMRDKQYIENKRIKIHQLEKRLEETLAKYLKELSEISQERKLILIKAKADATELLSGVNKKIENTIRDIRNIQAEKEVTKDIRTKFENYKKDIVEKPVQDDEKILRKIDKLKERENRIKIRIPKQEIIEEPQEVFPIEEIVVGDMVRLKDKDAAGEVIDIGDSNFVVALGNMITTVKKESVEKISNNELKKISKPLQNRSTSIVENMRQKMLEFNQSIDVRGVRGDEALQKIAEYIDQAIMLNVNEVRILHGKGHGILRQLIRDYLKTINMVKSFGDERIQFGGDGITVVCFK